MVMIFHFHFVIYITAVLINAYLGFGIIPDNMFRIAEARVSKSLNEVFERITKREEFAKLYNQYLDSNYMKLKKINPRKIMEEVSKNIDEFLRNEISALKSAVEFAEKEAATYRWNPKLQVDGVEYLNAKDIKWSSERMEYSDVFGQKIVNNESTVHIPVEIYEKDDFILKGIDYSKRMDEIWKKNSEKLKYQLFASGEGFMRIFPGMKWRNKGVDFYDVRKRSWYVEGSSSPKDVMFLIDTSGSMHGQSLQLMQISVKRLILTLSENDYVGVVQFPGQFRESSDPYGQHVEFYPHYILDKGADANRTCFKTFIQANRRNIQRIFKQIDELEASGIADLEQAIEFAFNAFQNLMLQNATQFDEDHSSNQGANCNRVILIVTDGGSYYPEDTIKRLYAAYPKLNNLRIFTYSVGEHNSYSEVLQRMACDNRGHFSNIPAVSAVSHIVQAYLIEVHHHSSLNSSSVVSERKPQMSLHRTLPEKYLSEWHQELGVMTSLTLPVFNRTANQSLLGLMSTDVTVSDLQNLIPQEKLGPNGYGFAVNMNGFLIFHPGLKPISQWISDPPNIDFLDVEYTSPEKEELRRHLIDKGASNSHEFRETIEELEINDYIAIPDDSHVYKQKRIYVYAALPHAPFGMAIVIPKDEVYYLDIMDNKYWITQNNSEFLITSESGDFVQKLDVDKFGLLLSEAFEYCLYNASRQDYYLRQALMYEEGDDSNFTSEANDEIKVPENIDQYTFEALNSLYSAGNISVCLTPFRCGAEKCRPYEVLRHRISRMLLDLIVTHKHMKAKAKSWEKDMKPFDSFDYQALSVSITTSVGVTRVYPKKAESVYKEMSRVPKSALYQRAHALKLALLLSVPLRKGVPNELSPRNASTDVFIFGSVPYNKEYEYNFGVMGTQVTQKSVQDLLLRTDMCSYPSENLVCLLLDDGGYIISAANKNSDLQYMVGHFFGYVYPSVMKAFINESICKPVEDVDFQATCERVGKGTSGAFNWKKTFLNSIVNLISSLASGLHMWFQIFVNIFCLPSLSDASEEGEKKPEPVGPYDCIKVSTRYICTTPSYKNMDTECMHIKVGQVRDTNLLIVVLPYNNTCEKSDFPRRDAKEDDGQSLCEQASSPRYRKPPRCTPYKPDNTNPLCLSCTVKANIYLVIGVLLLVMCFR